MVFLSKLRYESESTGFTRSYKRVGTRTYVCAVMLKLWQERGLGAEEGLATWGMSSQVTAEEGSEEGLAPAQG